MFDSQPILTAAGANKLLVFGSSPLRCVVLSDSALVSDALVSGYRVAVADIGAPRSEIGARGASVHVDQVSKRSFQIRPPTIFALPAPPRLWPRGRDVKVDDAVIGFDREIAVRWQ